MDGPRLERHKTEWSIELRKVCQKLRSMYKVLLAGNCLSFMSDKVKVYMSSKKWYGRPIHYKWKITLETKNRKIIEKCCIHYSFFLLKSSYFFPWVSAPTPTLMTVFACNSNASVALNVMNVPMHCTIHSFFHPFTSWMEFPSQKFQARCAVCRWRAEPESYATRILNSVRRFRKMRNKKTEEVAHNSLAFYMNCP